MKFGPEGAAPKRQIFETNVADVGRLAVFTSSVNSLWRPTEKRKNEQPTT